MFWNKKDYVKRFDYEIAITSIAEMIGGSYKVDGSLKTPGNKTIQNEQLAKKLDLILDHLKLKYVPETETKEPAKLVENTTYLGIDWGTMKGDKGSNYTWTGSGWIITPPAKKQGRPKKK